MKSVTVFIGSGLIGIAIARRVSPGKHRVLADVRAENAESAATRWMGGSRLPTSLESLRHDYICNH
jgi:predicted dinucleotide-binding enzyme